MSYLGLDIGTSGCKAAVYNNNGTELAVAHREYKIHFPHARWAELESTDVINKCFEVIREVNALVEDPVLAMSISSQGEAFTPIGADGKILGNAMISSDSRAADITDVWTASFGEDKLYNITGHTPHPLFTLYKLIWLKENKPEIWNKAKYFLCFEDLFHYKTGLEPHISWPLAGRTMLFDVTRHNWSNEILSAISLKKEQLARPIPSGQEVGYIKTEYGKNLGFKNDVLVVAGGHDQTCAALGAGVNKAGFCMYATGTAECFCPVLEKPRFSQVLKENNLCCYDYTIPGNYTTIAYSLTGGSILKWVRDELSEYEKLLAKENNSDPYQLLLDEMPRAPTDLLVLPYFSPTGTPYFDNKARGAILGLQQTTNKGELIKALLEGVSLEMKLNLEIMEKSDIHIHTFIATGGGSQNDMWNQLKADVLHKKIIVRNIKEAGCYGASVLAYSAESNRLVNNILDQNNVENKIFYPNKTNAKIYDLRFIEYKKLYPALKQFWT